MVRSSFMLTEETKLTLLFFTITMVALIAIMFGLYFVPNKILAMAAIVGIVGVLVYAVGVLVWIFVNLEVKSYLEKRDASKR